MNNDDPYTPVRVPVNRFIARHRPYYIYSTAVVMLLWAGIYIYLESQYAVSIESDGASTSTPVNYTNRLHDFSVTTIALLFLISLVIVNGVLWATFKTINR